MYTHARTHTQIHENIVIVVIFLPPNVYIHKYTTGTYIVPSIDSSSTVTGSLNGSVDDLATPKLCPPAVIISQWE